jgi:hypothetical protein
LEFAFPQRELTSSLISVNAMLLNEFLKEHRKVEKLEATVAQQHKDFEAAVAELKAEIQKVSAQLEVSKPANSFEQSIKLIDSYHSLKSPLCSCVSITVPASS